MIINNIEIKTIKKNNTIYFRACDVCCILKYKNQRDTIKRHCKNHITEKIQTTSGFQNCVFINQDDFFELINKSYTFSHNQKNDLLLTLQENGIYCNNFVLKTRQELEFFDLFEKTLVPFNYEYYRQYQVLSYRVDFYIKDLNVAIEYDENHHYSQEKQDIIREKAIKTELRCRIIRISSNDTHLWNVGFLFKNLFI